MNSHAFNARYPCNLCIPVTVKMTVRVVAAWLPIEKNKVTPEETKTRDRTEAAISRTEADPLQPMISRNQSRSNCELDRDPI